MECINYNCESKPNGKLFDAPKDVCSYYTVNYGPNSKVCEPCLEKSVRYLDRVCRRFRNQECVLDDEHPRKRRIIVELSDSDDDDDAGKNTTEPWTEDPDPQTAKLSTVVRQILKDTVGPLVAKQNELCESYLISKKAKLERGNEIINDLMRQADEGLSELYKELYKFDSQRKFEFDEELSIMDDVCGRCKLWNKDVDFITTKQLPGLPDDLPTRVKLIRRSLKEGDKVYGMKQSLLHPWVEATIKLAVSETDRYFNIIFDDGQEIVLNYKHLAYINTSSVAQHPVGSRVIAKFQDMNIQLTDKFYAGIIAEPPKYLNNFRYLIFFDDGCTQYVYHKNIRLVCGQSQNVIDDVHENVREFIQVYLEKYPERPMVKFNKKQIVRTELNNTWGSAKVKNIDASLVQLKFLDTKNGHTEWMYRGSNRLGPIFNRLSSSKQNKPPRVFSDVNKLLNRPFIELENLTENDETNNIADNDNTRNTQENSGVIKPIEIPANCPKPLPYTAHQCSNLCIIRVFCNYSQTKDMNVLSFPLCIGFMRSIITDEKTKLKKVIYTTPCGCNIDNEGRMYEYLKVTEYDINQITIDLFNFDCMVDPLSKFSVPKEFIRIPDISFEMERKTISVVNCLNASVPKHIKYIKDRKTSPDINLNINSKFLCGCDCIDNCEDKEKCSCWQLTNEGPKNYPNYFIDHDDIGYSFKRLHKRVITGIYECNASCKCNKTCLNRVVQEPLKTSLQLFLTENKGWGVRTLADIPKGSFVCTYLGVVRTDADTENDLKNDSSNWGQYLGELDFIEIAEEAKDGYESHVVQPEDESEHDTSSSDYEDFSTSSSDDASDDPNFEIPNKINKIFKSKMSLRNLQGTHTKIDGKHELSKLNIQQKDQSESKSLRRFLDKDCGSYTLDSKLCGNVGRYFNHSCDPNIFIQNVFVDTHDLRFPWVAYFALSNIPAGTELAWDYNYTVGCVKDKKIQCYCGARNCRGRLL